VKCGFNNDQRLSSLHKGYTTFRFFIVVDQMHKMAVHAVAFFTFTFPLPLIVGQVTQDVQHAMDAECNIVLAIPFVHKACLSVQCQYVSKRMDISS